MLPAVAGTVPGSDPGPIEAEIEGLGRLLGEPSPDPEIAEGRAAKSIGLLEACLRHASPPPPGNVMQANTALIRIASDGLTRGGIDWDRASQLYVALRALSRPSGEGDRSPDPELSSALEAMYRALRIPDQLDSPKDWGRTGSSGFRQALGRFAAASGPSVPPGR
jgi:hypothetical protein